MDAKPQQSGQSGRLLDYELEALDEADGNRLLFVSPSLQDFDYLLIAARNAGLGGNAADMAAFIDAHQVGRAKCLAAVLLLDQPR